MNVLRFSDRTHACLLVALVLFAPEFSFAEIDTVSADGWHSWKVDAPENAPAWCCYDWNAGVASPGGCDLDAGNSSFGSWDGFTSSPEQMQIYALLKDGEAKEIRALSPACRVSSKSPVRHLGLVSVDDSIDWLQRHASPRNKLSGEALAAIAVHDGHRSRELLIAMVEQDAALANRKDALFWLGQVRGQESLADIERVATEDEDDQMRKHAMFVLAQLPDERGVDALLAALTDDGRRRSDRKAALFWLVQTESDRAFDYIGKLLTTR